MGSPAVAPSPVEPPPDGPEPEVRRETEVYLPVDEDGGERPYVEIPAVNWLSKKEEREKVERAKAGDREALHEILYAFRPIVARAIQDIAPDVDRHDPLYADLYHDGFRAIRAAVEGYSLDADNRFGPYARSTVRNTITDAKHAYASIVTVNREYRRFLRKFKAAELAACRAVPDRDAWPWYGEVARYVAEAGREEIVRVWRNRFPNDPPPDPLWPEGLELEGMVRGAQAERIDRIITCVGILQNGLNQTARPSELDDTSEIQSDGWVTETVTGYEMVADPSTDPATEETEAVHTRQEARSRLLGKLAQGADLPRWQAYAVMATLGLDGKGSRTPEEIAAELTKRKGSPVRPWSVRRSIERAAERIWESMISPAGSVLDPFLSEPEAPEPGLLDPYAAAKAELEAVKRRRYFDAFTAVEGEVMNRWEARREEEPPAASSESDVHNGPWTHPHTGVRYRSAPRIVSGRLTDGARTIWLPWNHGFG